jgi:HK97 gp10 family phage protein
MSNEFTVIGSTELIKKLNDVTPQVRQELRGVVDLMTMKTLARVKMKLSDDVLHVRTGRLRRSITQTVTEDGGNILGTVGTNVVYARFQELGFSGTQNVRESLRTIKTAFGKSIKGGAVTFTVRAHSRHVNYPAHSFLATALKEMGPEFNDRVNRAMDRVNKGIGLKG